MHELHSELKSPVTQLSVKGLSHQLITDFKVKLASENTSYKDWLEEAITDYLGYWHNVYIEDIKAILEKTDLDYIEITANQPYSITRSVYSEDLEKGIAGIQPVTWIYYPSEHEPVFLMNDKVYSLDDVELLQEEMIEISKDDLVKKYYKTNFITKKAWTIWASNFLKEADFLNEDNRKIVNLINTHLVDWTDFVAQKHEADKSVRYNTKKYGDLREHCVSSMALTSL